MAKHRKQRERNKGMRAAGGVLAGVLVIGTGASAFALTKSTSPTVGTKPVAETSTVDLAAAQAEVNASVGRLRATAPSDPSAFVAALNQTHGSIARAMAQVERVLRGSPSVDQWVVNCVTASGTVRTDGQCAPGTSGSGASGPTIGTGGSKAPGGNRRPPVADPITGETVCDKAGRVRPRREASNDFWREFRNALADDLRRMAAADRELADALDPVGQALGDTGTPQGNAVGTAVTGLSKLSLVVSELEKAAANAVDPDTAGPVVTDHDSDGIPDDEDPDSDSDTDTDGQDVQPGSQPGQPAPPAPRGNSTPTPGAEEADWSGMCEAWKKTAWMGNPELMKRLFEGRIVNRCEDPVTNPVPATGTARSTNEVVGPTRTIQCPGATTGNQPGSGGCNPALLAPGERCGDGNGLNNRVPVVKTIAKQLPFTACPTQTCTPGGGVQVNRRMF